MAEITDIKKHGTPESDPEQSIEGSKSALKATMCYAFDFMAGCQNIQEDIGCAVWEERMRSLLSSLSFAEEIAARTDRSLNCLVSTFIALNT